ncbi:hypothetical protein WA026_009877 [Henosepilachna vigintioctopunctata]|uniref:UDP-glucuronosyltransferase n=1 Tax=Henosepilachna vigintioctopunctata TaxID=420089 RepID=A0AAW1TQH4_9CUCU
MDIWLRWLVLACVVYLSQSYKILGVFPHVGLSHFIVMRPLMKELANRGHEVTVLSHFPLQQKIPRYKDISLSGTIPILVEELNLEHYYDSSRLLRYRTVFELDEFAEMVCQGIYGSGRLNEVLQSSDKYDLIIVEMFNSDCLLPINSKINAPIVGISSCFLLPWLYERFGIPHNPSYIPHVSMNYPKNMNFFERLENTVVSWISRLYYSHWRNEKDNRIARRYFKENIPHVSEFANNASLILVNTHFSINNAFPYPPNVIEVGGIHLPAETEALPEKIEKFIEESPEGVIFFSLGSMVKSDTLPLEKREVFLRTFARLPQRVLWKWENETLPDKPNNVMIQKWMSQFDILSHPNVVAFICHGGLLGIMEAVQNGVPMLLMPHRADQFTNAKAVEDNGGGTILQMKDVDDESLYGKLKRILHPEFKAKARALSSRFMDRPMSPMDTAVYWVEYVARHKSATHMRTAAVDMPFYQYLLLDVIAFLIAIIFISMYIVYKVAHSFLRIKRATQKVKLN